VTSVTDQSDVAVLLAWLKVEGDVLEAVRDGWTGADITHRTMDQVHPCLRCGQQAQLAYVAHTDKGPRWLDLCPPCGYAARKANGG
jgi:hypothetical protein